MPNHLVKIATLMVVPLLLNCYIDQERIAGNFIDTPTELHTIRNVATLPPGIPNANDCDVPPQPIKVPFPPYPEVLRQKRIDGSVTFLFIIDSLGTARDPQILFATDSLFATAVLESFPGWKIVPAQIKGQPVTCYKQHTFDFELTQ
jgi:outer membrane biosynthesis protein TonB